jgi:ubiquinone/menaquinone biosynthesis C-methylase UbiE
LPTRPKAKKRTRAIPTRVRWAVDSLEIQPDDHILEIGGGRGVAAALVCERLRTGKFVGLDRSATAIAASQDANRTHIESGKARFIKAALADAKLTDRFHKIFAINVNVFWLGPEKELAVMRRLLAPKGRLYLFYEPPSWLQLKSAAKRCSRHLEEGGFNVERVLRDGGLLGLVSRRSS